MNYTNGCFVGLIRQRKGKKSLFCVALMTRKPNTEQYLYCMCICFFFSLYLHCSFTSEVKLVTEIFHAFCTKGAKHKSRFMLKQFSIYCFSMKFVPIRNGQRRRKMKSSKDKNTGIEHSLTTRFEKKEEERKKKKKKAKTYNAMRCKRKPKFNVNAFVIVPKIIYDSRFVLRRLSLVAKSNICGYYSNDVFYCWDIEM